VVAVVEEVAAVAGLAEALEAVPEGSLGAADQAASLGDPADSVVV